MKLFISHASEDKAAVARPLAQALQRRGFTVWYDEFVLRLGDSLQRSIDRGLAECDFGVVVLSNAFFSKRWPQQELSGLFAREFYRDQKIVLPIWHQLEAEDIRLFSPLIADRVAVSTSKGLPIVVDEIVRSIQAASLTELAEQQSELKAGSAERPVQHLRLVEQMSLKPEARDCPSCRRGHLTLISSHTGAAEGTFTRHFQVLQCNDCPYTLSE